MVFSGESIEKLFISVNFRNPKETYDIDLELRLERRESSVDQVLPVVAAAPHLDIVT